MDASHVTDVDRAVSLGADYLFTRQQANGVFTFDSSRSATLATSGAITALHFADRERFAGTISRGAAWLRHNQCADGGWPAVVGDSTEAVPTAIAAATLRLVAGEDHADAVNRGRQRLGELGGLEAIADPVVTGLCRQFHAFVGWQDQLELRRLPLEVVLLPAVRRKRISFRSAPFIGMALAQAHTRPTGTLRRFVLRLVEPVALRVLREIYHHEGDTGEFGADAWAAGLLCIGLARAGVAPDLVEAITAWLVSTANPDGSWEAVRIDLTWSGFAATGLVDAGYADDPRLRATQRLFHDCQQDMPFRPLACPPGGWSYSGPRGWPVTLESAELLSALAGMPDHEHDDHLRRGIDWLASRQDSRGSWSLWVKDTKLANDGPCPYLTCQALDALLDKGLRTDHPRVVKAVRWLETQQHQDGSFEALWYRDHTAGTSLALGTLARVGRAGKPVALRARRWLLSTQRTDGSWGSGDGGDSGTVEETAWALRALLGAGVDPAERALRRAATWLVTAQHADGRWPEAPVSAYIRRCVHYRNGGITMGLALRALARYREFAQREES